VEEVQAGATLLDKRVYGRGGTAYRPVFDWISANLQDNVDAVVYATDGDCWDWVSTPPYPLFWLIPEALTTRNPANGALASLHACHRARGGGQYSHGNILFEGETIAMDETLRVAY
jgi:hypothetical protein